jgi:hypothetical protein
MPSEQLFNRFADIPALQQEKAQIKEIFSEIKGSIIELSGLGLKLDTTKGMNDIVKMQQQVGQLQDKLLSSQNKLAESEAKLEKIRNQSAVAAEKADLLRTQNIIAQNKELDRQIALEEKRNNKIAATPKPNIVDRGLTVQGAGQFPRAPLTNISLQPDTKGLNELNTVVNEIEISEAQLANESTALNVSLKEQGVVMSEVGAEVSGVVLQYDAFTGSMLQNIKVQYENAQAIQANKKEQQNLLATIEQQQGATDAQISQLAKLKEEAALLAVTNKDLTATIRLQAQAFVAEEGGVTQLAANLELLQREYSKLGKVEQGSAFGKSIKAEIDLLDPALKKAEEGIGKTGRQVGSYSNAITKSLGGAFGFLRQIAYVIPGIGLAGLIGGLADGVIELTKSMFSFGDSIERDTSRLGVMKENLAQFNDEVKTGSQNLEEYFKYLDRITTSSKIDLKINDINVNPITKLRNELNGLQLDVSTAQTKYLEAEKEFEKVSLDAGQIQDAFLNHASADAVKAFYDKTIESVKDGLSDTDKVLYQGLLDANAAIDKSGERLAVTFASRNAAVQKINEQVAEISKQSADEQRQIEKDSSLAIQNIIKAKNDNVLSNERSTLTERLNALKSNYYAEQSIISANEKYVLSDPTKSSAEKNSAIKTAQTELVKNQISFQQNQYKLNEEFRLKDAKASHDYYDSIIKDDEAFQRKLIDNTIGSINTRQEALDGFVKDQLQQSKNNFQLQLQQAGFSKQQAQEFVDTGKYQIEGKKITNEELLSMQRSYESEILSIARNSEEDQTKIVKEEIEKQDQLRQESIDRIENAFSSRSLNTFSQYADDVIALNDANKKKLVLGKDYDNKRREIDRKYREDTLQQTIDTVDEELNEYLGVDQRLVAAEIKLQQDKDKLRKLEQSKNNEALIERLENEIAVDQADYDSAKRNVDAKIKLLEKLKKAQQDLSESQTQGVADKKGITRDKILDVLDGAKNVSDQLTALGDQVHDRKIQQYEDQKKVLEDRYNKEIDFVNKTYANSIQKQAALDAANKRYAQSKAALDAQEREQQLKKARFDKAQAIFSIVINTAAAIVRDLGNPIKVAFDAIIGAIELATASAAPLPAYWKGTPSSKGGLALVGERGRELGVEPSGRIVLWEKPTLTNLIQGTKIFPNEVTEKLISSNRSVFASTSTAKVQVINNSRDEEIIEELRQLNNKPPLILSIDNKLEATAYYQNQLKR